MPKRTSREEPIGLLIGAVRRRIKQSVIARLAPFALTPQQFWFLVAVAEREPSSLSEIAQALRMDAPTASRVLKTLLAKKLVGSTEDPKDRRRRRLRLSAKGRDQAKVLVPLAQQTRQRLHDTLSPRERDALRVLLRKVIAGLDAD